MTKLYLRSLTAPSGMPTSEQSSVLPVAGGQGTWATNALNTSAGAIQDSTTASHTADTNHHDYFLRAFGFALGGANITAENWTVALAGFESNAAANTCFNVSIYVYRSGTGVIGYVFDAHFAPDVGFVAELDTAEEGRVSTNVSGAAVSGVQSGDLLVLEVWHHIQQSMASAYTSAFYYNGATDPADQTATSDAASYISCTQDLTAAGGAVTPRSFIVTAGV